VDLKNGIVVQDAKHLRGYSAAGAGTSFSGTTPASIDVEDGAGWTFRVFDDGRIQIIGGASGVGTVYQPGSPQYEQVLATLRTRNVHIDAMLNPTTGTTDSKPFDDFVTSFMAQMQSQGQDPLAPGATPTTASGQQQSAGTVIAQLLQQYGPGAATAASELFSNQGASLVRLETKLAALRGKYVKARRPARKAKLAAQIGALESQIRQLRAAQASASYQLAAPPPPKPGLPSWIPIAAGGLLVVIGAAILLTPSKKR